MISSVDPFSRLVEREKRVLERIEEIVSNWSNTLPIVSQLSFRLSVSHRSQRLL